MAFNNAVYIGPEFFAKARNDYADWRWAVAKEFAQNCIDAAGCDHLNVQCYADNGTTIRTVTNNGDPMSQEILTGKLLALGGSGKNFAGTVGGFGKAKEILYFCHKEYTIHTGNLKVTGAGAGYNIDPADHLHGTESRIVIEGDHVNSLKVAFTRFFRLSQWKGTVIMVGKDSDEADAKNVDIPQTE